MEFLWVWMTKHSCCAIAKLLLRISYPKMFSSLSVIANVCEIIDFSPGKHKQTLTVEYIIRCPLNPIKRILFLLKLTFMFFSIYGGHQRYLGSCSN